MNNAHMIQLEQDNIRLRERLAALEVRHPPPPPGGLREAIESALPRDRTNQHIIAWPTDYAETVDKLCAAITEITPGGHDGGSGAPQASPAQSNEEAIGAAALALEDEPKVDYSQRLTPRDDVDVVEECAAAATMEIFEQFSVKSLFRDEPPLTPTPGRNYSKFPEMPSERIRAIITRHFTAQPPASPSQPSAAGEGPTDTEILSEALKGEKLQVSRWEESLYEWVRVFDREAITAAMQTGKTAGEDKP